MLRLSEHQVQQLLEMDAVIAAVEQGFRDLANGQATNLPRRRVRTTSAMLHLMGAASRAMNLLVYKAYSTSAAGAWFHVRAYRGSDGMPLAELEADWLGRFRTGAASAVSVRYMARPDAAVLAVIGCGRQAETQIRAIARVRKLDAIYVYSRTPERREQFAHYMASEFQLPVEPAATAQAAVADADIIVTITNSSRPVLHADWVRPGAHVCAAGSNSLQRCELDPELVLRADIVAVDSVEQARMEAGDLAEPIASGKLSWDQLVPLEKIVSGQTPGRVDERQITLFESLGIGIEDLVATHVVLQKLLPELTY